MTPLCMYLRASAGIDALRHAESSIIIELA